MKISFKTTVVKGGNPDTVYISTIEQDGFHHKRIMISSGEDGVVIREDNLRQLILLLKQFIND